MQSVVQQHGLNPEEAILYIDRRSGEEQWRTEDIVKFIEEHVRTVLPICMQVFISTPAFSSPTGNQCQYTSALLFDWRWGVAG